MKKENGITLVALVISIIVLIILASIAINTLINNGIINKAKNATQEYKNAQDYEETQIAKYTNDINSYVNGNRDYADLLNKIDTLEKKIEILENRESKVLYDNGKITTASVNTKYDLLDNIGNYTFIIIETIGGADPNTWRCSDIFSVKEITNSDEYYATCSRWGERYCNIKFYGNSFSVNNINDQYPIRLIGIKI